MLACAPAMAAPAVSGARAWQSIMQSTFDNRPRTYAHLRASFGLMPAAHSRERLAETLFLMPQRPRASLFVSSKEISKVTTIFRESFIRECGVNCVRLAFCALINGSERAKTCVDYVLYRLKGKAQ